MYQIRELLDQYQDMEAKDMTGLKVKVVILQRMQNIIHRELKRLTAIDLYTIASTDGQTSQIAREWIGGFRNLFELDLEQFGLSHNEVREKRQEYKSLLKDAARCRSAEEFIAAFMQAMNSLEQGVRSTGIEPKHPAWPLYLWAYYNRFKDRPLQDSVGEPTDLFEQLRLVILRNVKSDRLEEFSTPITWGEVFFYFIKDCVDKGDRSSLKELDGFFPSQRLCIECDQPFEVSKRNPGYFRCPKCSAKERQRRHYAKRDRQNRL